MTKRILDIVDMQNDFMMPKGALYVSGAEEIIPKAKKFLSALKGGEFDLILMKYDTHFRETYDKNPESKQFPLHCVFNDWGWKMAFDLPKKIMEAFPVFQLNKNVFDMWGDRPDMEAPEFDDAAKTTAYKNLFNMVALNGDEKPRPRADFMADKNIGPGTEVIMMGVASDYCVHDAMLGYLQRGCQVTVISDLVRGIGTDVPGRAPGGQINNVLELAQFKPYVEKGLLRTVNSENLLKDLKKEEKNEQKSKNSRCPVKSIGRRFKRK